MSDNIVAHLRRDSPLSWPHRLEAADEIIRLREENARLREALLFAELMASEMAIDAREKCQRIYDELYKIRAAAAAIREGGK